MRVALAADHAGFFLKGAVAKQISHSGHQVMDLGAQEELPDDDYPDFAELVASAVREGRAERGILVCGSGVGVSVAANKLPGVRAAVCSDHYSAHQGVEHDDLNVLCLGARVVGSEVALEIVDAVLSSKFSGDARHARRLNKTKAIEARWLKERQ
ncbi:MAG: ribose 5-phosphate isomerase B [Myxococcaceae bacterium]